MVKGLFRFRMNIKQKATALVAGLALLACAVLGVSSAYMAREGTMALQTKSLSALRDARKDELHHYFETIDQDITLWAQSPITIDAIRDFGAAWGEIGGNPQQTLQQVYIQDNPHPAGQKDNMTESSSAPEAYGKAHVKYHPKLKLLKDQRGYYDIFLFDTAGNLVYSVYKEADFATNFVNGTYSSSGLGEVFRAAQSGSIGFTDFAPYAPSNGAAASFISRQVLDANGQQIGVIAFQMPIDRMDAILNESRSLGEGGGLTMVGVDNLMRHNSVKYGEGSILTTRVENEAISKAIAGEKGVIQTIDALGAPVLAAYAHLDFHGVRWAFMAEQTLSYVLRPVNDLQRTMALTTGLLMIGVLLVAWLISRGAVRPIIGIQEAVHRLSEGQDVEVPGRGRHDEIGELARSMEHVYLKGLEAARLRAALDDCSTLVIVANRRDEIVFCNNRMREFFGRYAKEMNTHVQGFDPKGVIGANLSLFQPVLGEVLGSLNEIAGTREAQVSIGPRILEIAVTPVRNEDGERIGTVFEWVDKTDELRAGKEIDAVVAAAVNGDFTKRADLATAPTALANMGEQINKLADSVEQSVSETSRIVRSLSEGDLTERMQGNFHGVFEELSQNVNAMAERFSDLIGQIASMSQSVSDGTGQILSGSEDLASRAEQQASSLEETAATMEEMSASIKSNAEGSTRAKSLASEAATRADKGGQVVRDAVSSMGGIEESSKKIADIISVIDGIAFQTNLLALNAAVEAARAGDAGKGFAVVASEVRALAQRSSEASNDIRQLIDASAVQVADGVRLVTETGEFLESIVTSIDEVDKAIKKIAEASIEQASGAQEISTTVNHMDQMTQENASLADRSAATSRSLASGAQSLQQLVAFFKINETGREAALDAAWQDAEAEIAATAIAATAAVEAPAKPVPAAFKAASGGESWTDF